MTADQLPPPNELNPHSHIPNGMSDIFTDSALVGSLALNQDGKGEDVVLQRYEHEPAPENVLTDIVGLIKALGSEDTADWTQDHRDAALTTIGILGSRFPDVCAVTIEQRMWAANEYIDLLRAIPADADLNGAAYSLYELSELLPAILGDTSTKELSLQANMAVLCQWERLFGEQISDDPTVAKRAKILAYSPHGQAAHGYHTPPMPTAEATPVSDGDIIDLRIGTLIGETRDMLYATGNEQLILAAQKGDADGVVSHYAQATAPGIRKLINGDQKFWHHSLTFDDAPGFYEAIARYITGEWEAQNDLNASSDPEVTLANLAQDINKKRSTSQRPALDLAAAKRSYELESDPYDLMEADTQAIIDQARSYDALVDRIRELKDILNLTTAQALEHVMHS